MEFHILHQLSRLLKMRPPFSGRFFFAFSPFFTRLLFTSLKKKFTKKLISLNLHETHILTKTSIIPQIGNERIRNNFRSFQRLLLAIQFWINLAVCDRKILKILLTKNQLTLIRFQIEFYSIWYAIKCHNKSQSSSEHIEFDEHSAIENFALNLQCYEVQFIHFCVS